MVTTRGRPRIQETADTAVARMLAGAGESVDRPAWSTRSLAERMGLSQTIVSRAVRRLADGEAEAGHGTSSHADPPAARRLVLTAVEVDGHACRTTFDVAPKNAQTAPASGARVHRRRRAAFRAALRVLGVSEPPGLEEDLVSAVEVPLGALASLADAVESDDAGRWVSWRPLPDSAETARRGEALAAARTSGRATTGGRTGTDRQSSDSRTDLDVWMPRAGVSVTEMLAVRLRDAIIASDLRPGDALTTAYAARLLDVPRSVAADVLRRMVDDELLDGSRGDVRIPLASANDVIELYAARMLLGDVLLRAASSRPRRHLLRARRVLDAIAEGAAAGANVGDADLRFQQEVARASGLEQTVRLFESSTVRVRMLIAVLRMDYARTAGSILADDRRILAALVAGDADGAVRAWHRKTDAAVRHMHGRARHAAFDVALWRLLTAM